MALFNRKQDTNTAGMPAEVQDYYKAERRERTGKAWVLAIVTLLVTFLLAAGLFFGGRWIYRALFTDADTNSQTQSDSDDSVMSEENKSEGSTEPSASDSQTSSTNTDAMPATTGNTPVVTSPTTAPVTPPVTGPSELVNTGPGDE